MVVLHSLDELNEWQEKANWFNVRGGFVPTMGALHQGHVSLIEKAVEQCDVVVVSVLVNPTQFDEAKDFEAYPSTLELDCEMAERAGAAALFAPSAEELYGGTPSAPSVDWGFLTHSFEGACRPGHFDGVIAVVDLLFQAVRPQVAVFGQKDLQQVAVVKRLATERHEAVRIEVGGLVREASGLAMSSRNVRLDAEGKAQALVFLQAMTRCREKVEQGANVDQALLSAREWVRRQPNVTLEYLDVVDPDTFIQARTTGLDKAHVIVAGMILGVRLIDNVPLRP